MHKLLPIVILATSLLAQNNSNNAGAEASAQNLVKLHEAFGPAASSAGTSLTLKEASRSGSTIKIRMYATGLPTNQTYALITWPVTQRGPINALDGISIDSEGLAVCAGTAGTCGTPDKPNDPIDVTINPVAGEPLRLGLVGSDQKTRVFARIVPVPIRGEDRGCSVEATLLTPGAELVLIEGNGFAENSEVTMDANSEGEKHGGKLARGSDGKILTALLPYKQGLTRGTAKVTLKSAACSPSLSFSWGRRN